MRNIKLTIAYDGTSFSGWQRQPRKRTVQETIEEVLKKILQEKIHLISASRTDAGVHALGQAANFKTSNAITSFKLKTALNGLLPPEIAIWKVEEARPSFHATYSTRKKTYAYLIRESQIRDPFLLNRAWHIRSRLDLKAMRRAAKYLVGRHDFKAFQGTKPDTKTSVRRVFSLQIRRGAVPAPYWAPWGGGRTPPLQIDITANGFLKYMVRNIVGTLVEVGRGRLKPEEMRVILRSRDRKRAGRTAPAEGLYLVKIYFPSRS